MQIFNQFTFLLLYFIRLIIFRNRNWSETNTKTQIWIGLYCYQLTLQEYNVTIVIYSLVDLTCIMLKFGLHSYQQSLSLGNVRLQYRINLDKQPRCSQVFLPLNVEMLWLTPTGTDNNFSYIYKRPKASSPPTTHVAWSFSELNYAVNDVAPTWSGFNLYFRLYVYPYQAGARVQFNSTDRLISLRANLLILDPVFYIPMMI